jgi:hypothetical protein
VIWAAKVVSFFGEKNDLAAAPILIMGKAWVLPALIM